MTWVVGSGMLRYFVASFDASGSVSAYPEPLSGHARVIFFEPLANTQLARIIRSLNSAPVANRNFRVSGELVFQTAALLPQLEERRGETSKLILYDIPRYTDKNAQEY